MYWLLAQQLVKVNNYRITSFFFFFICRSIFELLLFFGKDEFVEHPLKDILDSFQVTALHQSYYSWWSIM